MNRSILEASLVSLKIDARPSKYELSKVACCASPDKLGFSEQGLIVKLKTSLLSLNWQVIRLQKVAVSGKQSGVL